MAVNSHIKRLTALLESAVDRKCPRKIFHDHRHESDMAGRLWLQI